MHILPKKGQINFGNGKEEKRLGSGPNNQGRSGDKKYRYFLTSLLFYYFMHAMPDGLSLTPIGNMCTFGW